MSNQNEQKSSEKVREAIDLLKQASHDKKVELSDRLHGYYEKAQDAKDRAVQKAKEKATQVDETVHRNPWPFIGGAAIFGFLVGLLMRFRKKG